ncbi:hypothetical protein HETIRDRAFT_116887 [Heterobasidion irregulare TC 32-1]|uniref:Uncharacterized protein n=1 Tax=Heterobasidion irregulare (strain TC 32-1) TaxID=747525 RepID=W4KHD1_HETIT|nr:uncharacterized protein HETIRDRAFT_116887 [Heterobasidion irregulare TC 32-1]ETW84730.1 hypothetical protein HETIRDRAFT_116887 [Heterobasidion irregulare TC 32-1]
MAQEITVSQFLSQIGIIIMVMSIQIICHGRSSRTAALGIFAFLAVFVAYILMGKGLKSRVNLVMLIATIIMFTSASAGVALSIFSFMATIQGVLIDQSSPNLGYRFNAAEKITSSFGFELLNLIGSFLNFMLSDIIVVWRAWTLSSENRKMMVGPLLVLFGSLATAIASIGINTRVFLIRNVELSRVAAELQYASWVLSLITNLATTSVIGYKAWQHRRFIKENLGQGNSRTRVEKIMALLVESGAFYCIFWIILLVNRFIRIVPLNNIGELILPISLQLAGIYPTVILVLVSLEKTIWDSRGSVVGSIDGNNTHMEFAPGPGIVSKTTASRHQISVIQLDTDMQTVDFERDDYRDSIKSSV